MEESPSSRRCFNAIGLLDSVALYDLLLQSNWGDIRLVSNYGQCSEVSSHERCLRTRRSKVDCTVYTGDFDKYLASAGLVL